MGYKKHFICGIVLTAIFVAIASKHIIEASSLCWGTLAIGLAFAFTIGVAKELFDVIVRKRSFSLPDVIYTIIGGSIGSLLVYLFYIMR